MLLHIHAHLRRWFGKAYAEIRVLMSKYIVQKTDVVNTYPDPISQ